MDAPCQSNACVSEKVREDNGEITFFPLLSIYFLFFLKGVECMPVYVCVCVGMYTHTHTLHVGNSDLSPVIRHCKKRD